MSDEQREAAWESLVSDQSLYSEPPDRETFDAGWDAAMAAKAEPVTIDREALVVAIMHHPWLEHRDEGWPTGYCPTCDKALSGGYNSPAHAGHLADAVIDHLAAQPKLTFSEWECQNGPETDIAAQPVTGTVEPVGWYEFIMPGGSTTHIGYVYEDGSVYLPEGPSVVTESDFRLASSADRFWKLERVEVTE